MPHPCLRALRSVSARFANSFLGSRRKAKPRRSNTKGGYKVDSNEVICENAFSLWRPVCLWGLSVPFSFSAYSFVSLTCSVLPRSVYREFKGSRIWLSSYGRTSQFKCPQQHQTLLEFILWARSWDRIMKSLPSEACGSKSVSSELEVCAGVAKVNLLHLCIWGIFSHREEGWRADSHHQVFWAQAKVRAWERRAGDHQLPCRIMRCFPGT